MSRHPVKVAIVGGGFAGLSLAWHLLSSSQAVCTVFDRQGIGGGASGIASGLLHPFPAAATQYSFMGKEAMHESLCLLEIAQQYSGTQIADYSGILKLALDDESKKNYSALSRHYLGLRWLDARQTHVRGITPCPALLIQQGVTVFCKEYLEGLWSACQARGGVIKIQEIVHPKELVDYDVKVFCHGASIQTFDPTWKLQWIKGQILTCRAPYPLTQRSVIAKGYIAVTKDPLIYHIGSTYEHHYKEPGPNMETAKTLILEPCSGYLECVKDLEVLQCRAAIRVSYPQTHLPVVKKYGQDVYALTAFGSRGLLYHGLLGKQLSERIIYNDDTRISREFFLSRDYT